MKCSKVIVCQQTEMSDLYYDFRVRQHNNEGRVHAYRLARLLTGFPCHIMPLENKGKQSSSTSLKAMNSFPTSSSPAVAASAGQQQQHQAMNPSACVSCQQVAQATAAQQCQMQHHQMDKHRRTPSSK